MSRAATRGRSRSSMDPRFTSPVHRGAGSPAASAHRATLARHRAIPAARRRPAAALGSIAMRRRVEASSRALRSHGLLRPRRRSAHGASPHDQRAGEPRSPGGGSRHLFKAMCPLIITPLCFSCLSPIYPLFISPTHASTAVHLETGGLYLKRHVSADFHLDIC